MFILLLPCIALTRPVPTVTASDYGASDVRMEWAEMLWANLTAKQVNASFPFCYTGSSSNGTIASAELISSIIMYWQTLNTTYLTPAYDVADYIASTSLKRLFYSYDVSSQEWAETGARALYLSDLAALADYNASYLTVLQNAVDAFIAQYVPLSTCRTYGSVAYDGTVESSICGANSHSKAVKALAYAAHVLDNDTLRDVAYRMIVNYTLGTVNLPFHQITQAGASTGSYIYQCKEDETFGNYMMALTQYYHYFPNSTVYNLIKAVSQSFYDHAFYVAENRFAYTTNANTGVISSGIGVHGFGMTDEALVQAYLITGNATLLGRAKADFETMMTTGIMLNNGLITHSTGADVDSDEAWNVAARRTAAIFYSLDYAGFFENQTWLDIATGQFVNATKGHNRTGGWQRKVSSTDFSDWTGVLNTNIDMNTWLQYVNRTGVTVNEMDDLAGYFGFPFEGFTNSGYVDVEAMTYTGAGPVFECAMNNMFELNGILEGNDTYRQMLLDSSPYENHGKMYPISHPYEGATLTWGYSGKALQFDGVDDYVKIADSESLAITEALSVEFWFMVPELSFNDQKFISKVGSAANFEWIIGLKDGLLFTELWTTSNINFYHYLDYAFEAGVFYYVGLTYDYRDAYYTVWLHGLPAYNVTTDGFPIRYVDGNMYLGSFLNGYLCFEGVLDEIRIYPYKIREATFYMDAKTPIRPFGRWDFINSGLSEDDDPDADITVTEGTTDGYQGFTDNDLELPWAYADATYNRSFVRAIRYVAGYHRFQLYCWVKYNQTNGAPWTGNLPSYLIWYWTFFRNGRMQSVYDIIVYPTSWTAGNVVETWGVMFRRQTPYISTEVLSEYTFTVNTTLFPTSIPLIISAWVGSDNQHFTVYVDTQDSRLVTSYSGSYEFPFKMSFELTDANAVTKRLDWFDGWIVSGVKANAWSNGTITFARMEVSKHSIDFLESINNVLNVIGSTIRYAIFPHLGSFFPFLPNIPDVGQEFVKLATEVKNVLVAAGEAVISAAKIAYDAVGNAISNLSHDIVSGFSGLGSTLSNLFSPVINVLSGIGDAIVRSSIAFSDLLSAALAIALWGWGQGMLIGLDGFFGIIGFPNFATNTTALLGSLFAVFGDSIAWVSTALTAFAAVAVQNITNFMSMVTMAGSVLVDTMTVFYGFMSGTYTAGQNFWVDYNIAQLIQVFMVFYPLYLMILWDQKGLGAVVDQLMLIKDVVLTVCSVLMRILDFTIGNIYRLIEAIPVAE